MSRNGGHAAPTQTPLQSQPSFPLGRQATPVIFKVIPVDAKISEGG